MVQPSPKLLLVAALLLAIPLLAYAVLGTHSRYRADDYCSASEVQERGIMGRALFMYRTWSGHFSVLITENLVVSAGHEVARVWPVLTLLLLAAAAAWAVRPLVDRALTAVVLAEAVILSTLSQTPNLYESLLWQNGNITYFLPQCFSILLVGFALRGSSAVLLPFIIAFAAAGFSEVQGAVQTAALTLALVASWRSSSPRRMLSAAWVGSLLAFLILVLAPGTAARRTGFPPPPGLVELAHVTLSGLLEVAVRSFIGLLVGIHFCLLLPNPKRMQPSRYTRWLWPAALILVLAAVVPGAYATSRVLPGRTYFIPHFALTCTLLGWAVRSRFLPINRERPGRGPKVAFASVTWLLLAVASFPLIWLWPDMTAYQRDWDSQDRQIQEARSNGQRDVRLPVPQSIQDFEQTDFQDVHFWKNECIAGYYDLDSFAAE